MFSSILSFQVTSHALKMSFDIKDECTATSPCFISARSSEPNEEPSSMLPLTKRTPWQHSSWTNLLLRTTTLQLSEPNTKKTKRFNKIMAPPSLTPKKKAMFVEADAFVDPSKRF